MKKQSAVFLSGGASPFRSLLILAAIGLLSACVRIGTLQTSLPGSSISYEQSWKAALRTGLIHYDQIAIADKKGGFFQTTWKIHKVGIIIGTPVRRSRLIGHISRKKPFQLDLTMEQEAFTLELGRWVSDPPDEKRFSEITRSAQAQMISR
ncbi:MAG: hypothetical protein ACE5FZ_00590 [Nitrospiria bacterium]